jgi:phenylacetate-CoA ligase
MFALVINEKKNHGISFKAIFSQGATLLPYQRDFIERVFACRVFDLYGHMERTVAISQCPLGAYHIHLDYGIAELVEPRIPLAGECDGDTCVKEIIGTSLHNFSMPLIRYRTGDYVKLKRSSEKCSCGRGFPVIASVIGRETDVVITPAGVAVTGLFTVFNHTPGVVMAQIIQEKIDRLLVKIVPASEYPDHTDKILRGYLRDFVGDDMDITMEHTTIEGITKDNFGKFKVVISDIPYERILE